MNHLSAALDATILQPTQQSNVQVLNNNPKIIIFDRTSPDSYPKVNNGDNPGTSPYWKFPELRKPSLTGAIISWTIAFDSTRATITTWYGQVGGAIQMTDRDVVPKAGRNIYEQGLQEVKQKYTLKIRDGYIPPNTGQAPMIKVMRGKDYKPEMKLNFPVFQDTKVDGIRMWTRGSGDGSTIEGYSRGNIKFPFVDHILKECRLLMAYLPPNSAIDGEIWNKDYSFQKITSIVRKTVKIDPDMINMEYHIFDVYWVDNPPFEDRRKVLCQALADYRNSTLSDKFGFNFEQDYFCQTDYSNLRTHTKIFTTKMFQCSTHAEINQVYEHFLAEGFEGGMLKKLANGAEFGTRSYKMSQYLFGKSTHILKLKPKIYEEAEVIDVVDAKGNEQGRGLLVVKDIRDNVFNLRMGDFEEREQWFDNPESIIGKAITFKYQNLTDAGIPRFPTSVAIRDYEPGFDPLSEEYKDEARK